MSLPDEFVPVSKVDEKIPIVGLKSILDSKHLKPSAVLGGLCRFHFLEEFNYLLRRIPFDFAAEKVVYVEDELISSFAVCQPVLGQLQQ